MFEKRPLGSLIKHHVGGGTPSRQIASFWSGQIPWASVKDFAEDQNIILDTEEHISPQGLSASTSNLIPENTVVICTRMAIGRAAITTLPIAINQDLKALFPQRGVNERYLLRLLQWLKNRAEGQAVGSTVKGIRISDLLSLETPIAPEDDQPVIADILDTLDDQIRQTEAIIAKLQQVKQGLLHDLLTRGIGADGQLRPAFEQAPELYKASPLGWIPKEWEQSNVAKEFDVDSGITLGPHRTPNNNSQKYLRVANVHRDMLILNDIKELEASSVEIIKKSIKLHDLLIVEGHASTEEIGRCAVADEKVVGMLYQNHLFRLQARNINPFFGLLWMNSSFAKAYWRCEAATSSGLNTINRTKLDNMQVAVPPPNEQENIVSSAQNCKFRLQHEFDLLTKLQNQKSGLMDDLLTGRVRVTALLNPQPPAQ